jgi:membrane-associated phospholipid phosphatase
LTLVWFFDTAKDCFPSQHVAVAFLTAFHVQRLSRSWGPPFFLLAIAIAISTLTTKQHYLWDVIAGTLMAGAAYRLSVKQGPGSGR